MLGGGSVNVFGFDAAVGVDVLLAPLGIPVTLFAGAAWSYMAGNNAFVYQLGIRLDFAL